TSLLSASTPSFPHGATHDIWMNTAGAPLFRDIMRSTAGRCSHAAVSSRFPRLLRSGTRPNAVTEGGRQSIASVGSVSLPIHQRTSLDMVGDRRPALVSLTAWHRSGLRDSGNLIDERLRRWGGRVGRSGAGLSFLLIRRLGRSSWSAPACT